MSPARKLNLITDDGVSRLFYRQPKWSELQSMVYGAPPGQNPYFSALIMRPSEDILDGLCESTVALTAALADAMATCWAARRADPQLIVEHGRQWRKVDPDEPMSGFPGYARISPRRSRRTWSLTTTSKAFDFRRHVYSTAVRAGRAEALFTAQPAWLFEVQAFKLYSNPYSNADEHQRKI